MGFRSDNGKKAYLNENTPKSECEKHPAGRVIPMKGQGKNACLFLYNSDGSPVEGFDDIENITFDEGEMQIETSRGEKESFEV